MFITANNLTTGALAESINALTTYETNYECIRHNIPQSLKRELQPRWLSCKKIINAKFYIFLRSHLDYTITLKISLGTYNEYLSRSLSYLITR